MQPSSPGGDWHLNMDSDLLCIADAEGRFISVNGSWERLLGWTRDDLEGHSYLDFVHPDDREKTMAQVGAIQTTGEVTDFVNRYRTTEGDYVWLRWSGWANGTNIFAVAMDITEDALREGELRRVLRDDHLLAYSQPILGRESRQVLHEELLARLRIDGSDSEVMSPAAFVPDAERFGMIGFLDHWMLTQALLLARRGRFSTINISARSIEDDQWLDEICATVEETPELAANLVFEITETAAFQHLDAALELTGRLGPLGCRFALDDFGTGYGSFTYLRLLPVEFLKIDMSFVQGLMRSNEDRALVRSVVAIASEFGLQTVAEGIEDGATFQLLNDYAVDHFQGYLIGRPAPVHV